MKRFPPVPAPNPSRAGTYKAARLGRLPINAGLAYLAFTFLLFLFGPIDYPIKNNVLVVIYFMLICVVMGLWFRFALRQHLRASTLNISRPIFVVGSILAVLILMPSSYYYTGKMPWEFLSSIGDQRQAYSSLSSQLAATEGQRGPIIVLRALAMPFVWAVIPLGIMHWSRLGWIHRGLFFSTILCSLIFSALRGTDREIADLLIVSGGAYAVAMARKRVALEAGTGRAATGSPGLLARRWRVMVIGALALTVSGSVFVERKEDRMTTISAFCFLNSGACADYSHPLIAGMNDSGRFATSMSVAYITNGYYGLSLALEKPFIPSWGIGHSSAISRIYELVASGGNIETRTFNYRNIDDGWPQEYFWSTMLTALANDVSFPGAVFLMGLFAWAWGRSWMDAVFARNDSAAIVFCLATFTVLYFPANLQILQTLEGYATVVFWMVAWLWFRKREVLRA